MTLRKAGLTGFFLFCMAPFPSLAETAAQLSKVLNTQASATAVLQSYCHRLYPGMAITATSLPANNPPPPYAAFTLAPDETIRVRHVSLRCGNIALSDAWNWYVPQRLTAEMNMELETSTTPFGRVVASLHFTRKPLESQTSDLPAGVLLRNRALLVRGNDGQPFSLVEENYLIAGFKSLSASDE